MIERLKEENARLTAEVNKLRSIVDHGSGVFSPAYKEVEQERDEFARLADTCINERAKAWDDVNMLAAALERARETIEVAREDAIRAGIPVPDYFRETLAAISDPSTCLEQIKREARAEGFDLIAHIYRQRSFSERTFGPGSRAAGVIAHIRKELVEVEQAPSDLEEWVDIVLLALDGAWRSGCTPEQIAAAIEAKQTKNEFRAWPDWRTVAPGRPIEHIKTKTALDGREDGGR